jgi:hydroxyethylthiazole kinase-like sugar kinase family protein
MPLTQQEIDDLARAPERTTTNEGTVKERPVSEMIKANDYAAANQVGDNPLHGLRISKFMPGGSV